MTWRCWCSGWLRRLAAWIEGEQVVVCVVPRDDLFEATRRLVAEAELRYPNGQARWHFVFGTLWEVYPHRRRAIAGVIEAACQEGR